MNEDLIDYYSKRAEEYEKVYYKPERQSDLAILKSSLPLKFSNSNLLEIGCGTGFWTYYLANSTQTILATDINTSVIEIAQSKFPNNPSVRFLQSDMYELKEINDGFSDGFAGFVWSHIKRNELKSFLKHFHSFIEPGGKMVFVDNQYVEGSNTPIYHTDEEGNTYQKRKLENGSVHLVLKNFPMDQDFQQVLAGIGYEIEIERLEYFWALTYRVK